MPCTIMKSKMKLMQKYLPYNMKVLMIFVVSLCVFLNVPQKVNGEVFTSLAVMENLMVTEAHVMKSITKYLPKVNDTQKKEKVKRFIAKCEREHAIALKNVSQFIGNPINAYRLIKRLSRDLSYVEEILKETTYYTRNPKLPYPTELDMHGATWALNHMAVVYSLNISDLANGTLNSNISRDEETFIEHVTPMTASDCYELGLAAQEYREHLSAALWMIQALRNYQDCDDCYFTDIEVADFISRSYYFLGDIKSSLFWREKALTMNLTENQAKEYKANIEYLKRVLDKKERKQKLKSANLVDKKKKSTKIVDNPDSFCVKNAPLNTSNSLTCYYKTGPQPFLKLARIKVELLHLNPDILMSPDLVSDNEIEQLLNISKPFLKPDLKYFDQKISNSRVAQSSTLAHGANDVIRRISRRVEYFTDMDVSRPRNLEIINYGLGGYHEPHIDPRLIDRRNYKKVVPAYKIATIIFYLSDVELGGATIFPHLALTVFPKRNAAVFWRNLLPSGDLDERSLHGECPVIRGYKWVATKWISYTDYQEPNPWIM